MLLPSTPAPAMTALAVPEPLPPASPLAAGIPEHFLRHSAHELARRVAMQIDDPVQLAVSMGLTETQWQVLSAHPYFKQLLDQAQADANSSAGLMDRVRLKALMALDYGGILDMVDLMSSPDTPPLVRQRTFDSLADVAGVSRQKDSAPNQVGVGPIVQINFPAGMGAPVTIGTATVIDQD